MGKTGLDSFLNPFQDFPSSVLPKFELGSLFPRLDFEPPRPVLSKFGLKIELGDFFINRTLEFIFCGLKMFLYHVQTPYESEK